jgi:hypothetical protein
MKRRLVIFTGFLLVFLLLPLAIGWQSQGDQISKESGWDNEPQICSDGAGGAIITWKDDQTTNDIYAQRINSEGASLWSANGIPICAESFGQRRPQIMSDSNQGAIIVWEDDRNSAVTGADIYIQQVNSTGGVGWLSGGILICNATDVQRYPRLCSDSNGGAIITWEDDRAPTTDIYAQRVTADGTINWTSNGISICDDGSLQNDPVICSDLMGGAYIVWQDNRSGNWDIYAQRVNSSGHAQWADKGIPVCNMPNNQDSPQICNDGTQGVIIVWNDLRGGGLYDLYAQRLNIAATPQWTLNGTVVSNFDGAQSDPRICSDGYNGAIICWTDFRNGGLNRDIYAQRLNIGGYPVWTLNGTAICAAADHQLNPQLCSDSSGGAIITWEDERNDDKDIYAQHIDESGTTQWTTNGVAVCTEADHQRDPQLCSSTSGNAIITWEDLRGAESAIYAQQAYLSSGGGIPGYPTILALAGLILLQLLHRRKNLHPNPN